MDPKVKLFLVVEIMYEHVKYVRIVCIYTCFKGLRLFRPEIGEKITLHSPQTGVVVDFGLLVLFCMM